MVYLSAVVLIFIYFCSCCSKNTRTFVPWAFLVAAIASFLVVLWVSIYIYSIHQSNYVLVKRAEGSGQIDPATGDQDKDKYSKQSKLSYVFFHTIFPLFNGLIYLLFFFVAKIWVEKNEG